MGTDTESKTGASGRKVSVLYLLGLRYIEFDYFLYLLKLDTTKKFVRFKQQRRRKIMVLKFKTIHKAFHNQWILVGVWQWVRQKTLLFVPLFQYIF